MAKVSIPRSHSFVNAHKSRLLERRFCAQSNPFHVFHIIIDVRALVVGWTMCGFLTVSPCYDPVSAMIWSRGLHPRHFLIAKIA